jgi:hypothetical protein
MVEKQKKVCKRCGKVKLIENFYLSKRNSRCIWCKDCSKDFYKKYYQKNRRRILKRTNEYKRKNKNKTAIRLKQKYKNCLEFRIKNNLQHRIHLALIKNIKLSHTTELIGCFIPELRRHIERQFKIGMTWDNYNRNGWHIDHIRPCASFDLSKLEEQKKCFHFTNLQPLWAGENLKKGSNY